MSARVLNVVLTHQSCRQVKGLLQWWSEYVDLSDLLIVHTGLETEFLQLPHPLKIHLVDQRLQTRDHQREIQSYSSVFRAIAKALRRGDWRYVNFSEYDQLPLRGNANAERVQRLDEKTADILGYQVRRIDGTNHPHWLYYRARVPHDEIIANISQRGDSSVVLSMFGSGSFWKREALENVSSLEEPMPIYLEVWLPTVAHHLGYRVLGVDEQQEQWVSPGADRSADIEIARTSGAWSLHPVKSVPVAKL